MFRCTLSAALALCLTQAADAVDLVRNGQPVAEIVTAEAPAPSVRTAAAELQRHLEAISGAKLPIVSKDSADVANHGAAGQDQSTSDAQASLWSTSAVLELYKLSGWRVIELRRIWANKDWPNDDPLTRHNAFTDLDSGTTGVGVGAPVGARGLICGLGDDTVFAIDPADHSARIIARHKTLEKAFGYFITAEGVLYYGSESHLMRCRLAPP